MEADYKIARGLHAIPEHLLDTRPDAEVDEALINPKPVSGEKNIWFFWHSAFQHMHGYAQRNIRAWHRRFSQYGWTVRVINRLPDSPLNVSNFLDLHEQRLAREIVEGCLSKSFGFKLAHGLIIRVMGQTLGSLWRTHKDSDCVRGTYAAWLRHGMIYWNQDDAPSNQEYKVIEPFKNGPLLKEA